jgi:methylated-DNA-protein-cysteine methyltransferase-like protein
MNGARDGQGTGDESPALRIRRLVSAIPEGRVATYGQIAALAGNNRAARLVAWVLHSSSSENLPWHRVINAGGRISLKPGRGYEEQRHLLEEEGVRFDAHGTIDLRQFLWNPADTSPFL